ncbi:secreted frizzled-related protein 3-like [Montipora capricornis]|uniref:secreted frizzled-related protein 3-like n=1 Tax=Montipora capricornis TaxID=246305 RepID=UPI0035F1FC27
MLPIQGFILTAVFQAACYAAFPTSEPPRCEIISGSFCSRTLPYNLTRFPNLQGDGSQASALGSIAKLGHLAEHANCSKDALFLLCSLFLPMCMPGEEEQGIMKPCRSLCRTVRNNCSAQIMNWPRIADCDKMPVYTEDICIRPESFIATSAHTRCQESLNFDYNQYDYVLKGQLTKMDRRFITVRVGRVFKQKNVTIAKGQHLKARRNTNGSSCPVLDLNKFYVIAGREDLLQTKLNLTSSSFILEWSSEARKEMLKWQQMERGRDRKQGDKKGVSNL